MKQNNYNKLTSRNGKGNVRTCLIVISEHNADYRDSK